MPAGLANKVIESFSEDGRTEMQSDVRNETGIVAKPYENAV